MSQQLLTNEGSEVFSKRPAPSDMLRTLMELLEAQEQIRVIYKIKEKGRTTHGHYNN